MDVHDDGKRIVGPDRAIGQNPDRFRAKRTLDMDLARRFATLFPLPEKVAVS